MYGYEVGRKKGMQAERTRQGPEERAPAGFTCVHVLWKNGSYGSWKRRKGHTHYPVPGNFTVRKGAR
jgi:hypothetical protein